MIPRVLHQAWEHRVVPPAFSNHVETWRRVRTILKTNAPSMPPAQIIINVFRLRTKNTTSGHNE